MTTPAARNFMKNNAQYLVVASVLVLFVIISRVAPHMPNFAPVAAIAIFAGALLPRRFALSLPLVAMIASDLVIGLHDTILFTWGSFVLIALLSSKYFRGNISLSTSVLSSMVASVLFFVITNFGVWLQGDMYARTLAGLVECYYMALPFFRNTLAGDMVYTLGLFVAYVGVRRFVTRGRPLLRQIAAE